MPNTTERPPAREVLADQAHIMWAHWMRYQLGLCTLSTRGRGALVISGENVARWRRLMETDYADLTEKERESDREQADRMSAALAAAGYPVEAMHAQLADIEEHGTAEINHAVALRGLLVEAIGLLRVIGDAADGPAGQKFPVTVQKGRHLTATHVAKCAALVDRARNAVTTTPPSFEAGPALVDITIEPPPPHETVLFLCSNGDFYQGRGCYGMHAPYWCGHSELNFGVVLADKSLTVTHWMRRPRPRQAGAAAMSEPTAEDREKALEIWQRNNPLRIDTPDDRYEPFVTDIAHALGATREESSARIAELEQDLAGGIRVKVAGKYLYTDERLQSEIAAAREEAEALAQSAEEDCQRAITARQKADLDLKCLQESTVDRKAWDQALARHEGELRALQSQIAELERERDEDRTHNRQLRTDSVTLRGKIIKLEGIIQAKNADMSDLAQERDRLRGALKAPGLYQPTVETDKVPTL